MALFGNDANLKEILICDNVNFTGSHVAAGQITSNGQLLIGSTMAPNIQVGNLTSTGGTLTITNGPGTINLDMAAGAAIKTINGNSGSVTGSIVTIGVAGNDGTALFTEQSATTLVLTFDDANGNLGIGNSALTTKSTQNTVFGALAGQNVMNGNVIIGYAAATNGTPNFSVIIGWEALQGAVFPANNVVIGAGAGSAYNASEQNNILLGTNVTGTAGENNAIHIGGTSATQCFITGIQGVTVTSPNLTYINTSTSKLGSSPNLITSPPSSNTATTAFGTSLTSGTSVQNTLGYDILLNISISITAATTATITMGVGPSTGPTVNTAIPSFSAAAATVYALSAVVPTGYWIVVNHTGTITVGSITVMATPL
jgi:hypothetical protein